MTGFFDIHTHILPGVDDGARDLSVTIQMLKAAKSEGISHIVATPHFDAGARGAAKKELEDALEAARSAAKEIDPGMTISLGSEIMNSPGSVDALNEKRANVMAGTRYVLVEFMPSDTYTDIYNSMHNYIMNGYIPILAHMERYEALYKREDCLDELIQLGVYMQMNAASLMGGVLHKRAGYNKKLLKEGYVHFLGSDCHDASARPPLMESMVKKVPKADMALYEKILKENPQKMLRDEYID